MITILRITAGAKYLTKNTRMGVDCTRIQAKSHLELAIPIDLRVSSLSAATFARHLKACLFSRPS